MQNLNFTTDMLKEKSAAYTVTEICQQPATWLKTVELIEEKKEELSDFLKDALENKEWDIVLTGAGSSEFVGNAVFPYLNKGTGFRIKSYATTDIVASPENYISAVKPTLLVSFGRSGNSPESVGAIQAAEAVSKNIKHLFITCNKNGELSKYADRSQNCFAINLPDETHDKGFAMTSSYSNMYLAALLSFNLNELEKNKEIIKGVAASVDSFLKEDFLKIVNFTNDFDYSRIVYLGSNSLKGIAQETALKMLELTAGKVTTCYDSPVGFRHGPKSVVNGETLTVIYLSDDEYTRKYEIDLIKEMSRERQGNKILVIASEELQEVRELVDFYYSFNNSSRLKNAFLALEYLPVGQLIALFRSLSFDITPDNPSPSGVVNRVVKGVIIYPYSK